MDIYFDTEFTGLHKNTTLISIGCISENDDVFYAEFTDFDESQVDEWIEENVLKNLILVDYNENEERIINHKEYYVKGNKDFIFEKFRIWLSNFDNVQFVSDVCHYDMVLLIDLFGNAILLPDNISPCCKDLNDKIASYLRISLKEAFDISRIEFLKGFHIEMDGNEHNSLFDAKVIRQCFYALKMGD